MTRIKKEVKELERLRDLQANRTRWFSQEEFDRLNELKKEQFKNGNRGVPLVPTKTLYCNKCGKYTQIVNHGEKKASCFYCGEKWAI